MSEHHPEETMAIVASDRDPDDLSDELIDELLAGARTEEEIVGPAACCRTSRAGSWSARCRPS